MNRLRAVAIDDIAFFGGIVLMGVGVFYWLGWPAATAAVGAVLTLVGILMASRPGR